MMAVVLLSGGVTAAGTVLCPMLSVTEMKGAEKMCVSLK